MSTHDGASFGGGDFTECDPRTKIAGVAAYQRRVRWLELRLDDGRGIAFDPTDAAGCEIAALEGEGDPDEGCGARVASISIFLRGRESIFIEGVDGWALWALIVDSDSYDRAQHQIPRGGSR